MQFLEAKTGEDSVPEIPGMYSNDELWGEYSRKRELARKAETLEQARARARLHLADIGNSQGGVMMGGAYESVYQWLKHLMSCQLFAAANGSDVDGLSLGETSYANGYDIGALNKHWQRMSDSWDEGDAESFNKSASDFAATLAEFAYFTDCLDGAIEAAADNALPPAA